MSSENKQKIIKKNKKLLFSTFANHTVNKIVKIGAHLNNKLYTYMYVYNLCIYAYICMLPFQLTTYQSFKLKLEWNDGINVGKKFVTKCFFLIMSNYFWSHIILRISCSRIYLRRQLHFFVEARV
jgi:hypothetical protein